MTDDEGRQPTGREGDDERLPRSPDELRVDVLALGGRAEPVRSSEGRGRREARSTVGL